LEDRLVKQEFRQRSQATIDRPEWPAPQPNPACVYRLVHRKSITASPAELSLNPRARSARLRVVTKL
jgi:16S rRNA (cytosine1402-N4)-methyltransferase